MSIRILSGLIGAVFALAVLIFNQNFLMLINVIISIISLLAMREIFAVMGIAKTWIITIPSLLFVTILPITGYTIVWQIAWYVYTLIIFGIMVLKPDLSFKSIVSTYSMAILITLSISKIVMLRDFGNNYGNEYGSFYVLLALGIACMSDTGAYFCGKYFGKNKLCPEVSPKKTIEGFIGGIIVCALSMILIAAIFNNFIFSEKHQINYVLIVILGLVGSPISALGDLCFSAIKRKCGVKDFGSLMPGHGGVLDRFDSVIFVSPYVYLFVKLITIIS